MAPRGGRSTLTLGTPISALSQLFGRLGNRSRQRKYRATLTIYTAIYTHGTLSGSDRTLVRDWLHSYLDRPFLPAPSFVEFELLLPLHAKAPFWAIAMNELSIPPAVPDERWEVPGRGAPNRYWATQLPLNFQLYGAVADQVRSYLSSKGVDISHIQPYQRGS